MKYRIRNSIATVLEVFQVLQESPQGLTRKEIEIIANLTDSKIENIICDLQNFKLVDCQGNEVFVNKNLVNSGNLAIANHLAKILKQHIVTREIYERLKPKEIISRGYLHKLIEKVYYTEKSINSKPVKEYTSQEYFQPLLFDVHSTKKRIATTSVGDYTSRMLGWFFFTGLLEYRSKEVILIPMGEGKQKGKLVEETEVQQLQLFKN